MSLPDKLPVHVEGHDLAGAEPRINELAVRHRARRCQIVLVVRWRQRTGRLEAIRPEAAPRPTIERLHEKVRSTGRCLRRRGPGGTEGPLSSGCGGTALSQPRTGAADASANLRGDEHSPACHDRRRNPDPSKIRRPGHIVRPSPAKRQPLLLGYARPERTPPLGPVLLRLVPTARSCSPVRTRGES